MDVIHKRKRLSVEQHDQGVVIILGDLHTVVTWQDAKKIASAINRQADMVSQRLTQKAS